MRRLSIGVGVLALVLLASGGSAATAGGSLPGFTVQVVNTDAGVTYDIRLTFGISAGERAPDVTARAQFR